MSDSYFIKRGESINGPFTLKKLQKALSDKKLKAGDLLAVSSQGPWVQLSSVYKEIGAGKAPRIADEKPDAERIIDEWMEDEQSSTTQPESSQRDQQQQLANSSECWVRFKDDGRIEGPFSTTETENLASRGYFEPTDEVGKSQSGPWTDASRLRKLELSFELRQLELSFDEQPAPQLVTAVVGSQNNHTAGDEDDHAAPQEQTGVPDKRHWNVEQLDTMAFIIDDVPYKTAFSVIAEAAAISHAVSGAFVRSGIIRGEGESGITFVITVKEQDDGTVFEIDGETPDGPVNFGAEFDPTSAGGWGLFAATSLFNSAVNNNAQQSVENDVLMLLYNILKEIGADDLLPDNGESGQSANNTASTAGGKQPRFDAYPEKYAVEYGQIYESGEKYKGSFNLMAFLFGPLWALTKGLWLHALLSAGAIIVTAGFLAIPSWIYTGFRGTYILYCKDVNGQQKAL